MTHQGGRKNIFAIVTTWGKLPVVLSIALVLLVALVSFTVAAPKQIITAKPGDCTSCHGSEKVLPSGHGDTKDMNYAGCLPCHPKTGAGSLRAKLPSSHTHQLQGINCEKCHGKVQKPEALEMDRCVACHDTGKLIEKTAKVKPENPHTSPHYGPSLDCNLCHHQHTKSENYCSQCHKFDFVVP